MASASSAGIGGKNGACGASPRALAERLVSGVPLTPSRGGAGGLPDLPREGRGRGVVSFGRRGMGKIYGLQASSGNRSIGSDHRLLRLRSPPAAPRALPATLVRSTPNAQERFVLRQRPCRDTGSWGADGAGLSTSPAGGTAGLRACPDLVRTTPQILPPGPGFACQNISVPRQRQAISAPHLWPDRCANPLPGRSQGAGPASLSPDHCAPRILAVRVRRWAQGTRRDAERPPNLAPRAVPRGLDTGRGLPRGPLRVRWLDRACALR